MCQCFQIGGPFIAEDPHCPIHGRGGVRETEDDLRQQIADLEERVSALEELLREKA